MSTLVYFQNMIIYTIIMLILLCSFLYSGWTAKRKIVSEKDYFFGANKLNWKFFSINAFGTNFSFLSASFVLILWSYTLGIIPMLWTILTGVAGIVLFVLILGKNFTEENSFDTLHHYISRDNSALRSIARLVTVLSIFGFIVAETYLFSIFFSFHSTLPSILLAVIFLLAAIINAYNGGYEAAVKNDKFQVGMVGFGTICLIIFIIIHTPSNALQVYSNIKFDPTPPFFISMLILLNGFSQFSTMDMWQRAKATANEREIRKGGYFGAFIFLIVSLAVVSIGMLFRIIDTSNNIVSPDPISLLNRLVETNYSNFFHSAFGYLMMIFFTLVYLTSLDSMYIALSNSLTMDVFKVANNLKLSKIITVLAGILIVIFTVFLIQSNFQNVIDLLVSLFAYQTVLVPTIAYRTWFNQYKLPTYILTLSILIGFVSAFVLFYISLYKPEYQYIGPLLSFSISLLIIIVPLSFFPKKKFT